MNLLKPSGGVFLRDGWCVRDCPLSLRDAAEMAGVVLACVALGIWLRRSKSGWLVGLGNLCLVLGALGLYTLNDAGRNLGIIRSTGPLEYYEPNLVSALCLLGAAGAAAAVKLLRRKR